MSFKVKYHTSPYESKALRVASEYPGVLIALESVKLAVINILERDENKFVSDTLQGIASDKGREVLKKDEIDLSLFSSGRHQLVFLASFKSPNSKFIIKTNNTPGMFFSGLEAVALKRAFAVNAERVVPPWAICGEFYSQKYLPGNYWQPVSERLDYQETKDGLISQRIIDPERGLIIGDVLAFTTQVFWKTGFFYVPSFKARDVFASHKSFNSKGNPDVKIIGLSHFSLSEDPLPKADFVAGLHLEGRRLLGLQNEGAFPESFSQASGDYPGIFIRGVQKGIDSAEGSMDHLFNRGWIERQMVEVDLSDCSLKVS